jgi:hypothetical protein
MNNPLHLIHLVSDQVLQNLLPVMALRPATITQVRSSEERFNQRAHGLEAAVRFLGKSAPYFSGYLPTLRTVVLKSPSPTVDETFRTLLPLVEDPPHTVVNYTGGTKMMSVGAYRAARTLDARCLYCDTAGRRFLWDARGPAPLCRTWPAIAEDLSVGLLVLAHNPTWKGCSTARPTEALIRFAIASWELKAETSPALSAYETLLQNHLQPRGRVPGSRGKLETLLAAPLPKAHDAAIVRWLDRCVELGLLRRTDAGRFPAVKDGSAESLRSQLEELAGLLGGRWLEIFVWSLLEQRDDLADLRWSIQPEGETLAWGETDLVCVDRRRLSLQVISCKQSLRRANPLEHMEALVQRARSLGGSHALPCLVILRASPPEAERIRRWARYLGIWPVIGKDEILALGGANPPALAVPSATGEAAPAEPDENSPER